MRSTVLIIDDSPTYREFLRMGLEPAGYRVIMAETGEQGLSTAQSAEVDAFIVDNLLPGVDGASVVRRLRQQVRHRRTPSLLLTASEDPAQELNALEAGADAFVRKDQPIEVLLARLAAILRSVGTPAAAESEQGGRAPQLLFVNARGALADRAAELLANEGVAVTKAAAAELPPGEFDCIVLGIDEVNRESDLVRELRARQRSGPPRVVLLGPSEQRSELVDAIAVGADDYLSWSADEAVVTARIRAQLRRKQLEDENERARENLVRHRLELEAQKQMAAARAVVAEELRIARDLAEAKAREAEDLLAQSEAVFRSMTEGLIISDLDGNLVQVNDSALAIYAARDREQLEMLFQPRAEICEMRTLSGSAVPAHEWPLALALRGKSVSSAEMVFLRRDTGHSFIGSFSAVPVNNREGRRILAALTVRDITSQKRSEEVFRRTEQLAVTGRLAAGIAHEINNPLAAVTNLLYLLRGPLEKDPQAADFLAMAQKELQRVVDITRQMLAFYRESTKPCAVDVCALAAEVMEVFRTNAGSAGVRLQGELGCEIQPLGFAGELRQVISHLVSNSIKVAPPNSVVRIRVRDARENGLAGVRISVADRGAGIPRSFYPEIFKPFASLKGSRGTGLGLWVTQSIVARHEGHIRFRSSTAAGRSGTVFSVFIPRSPSMKPDRSDPVTELFRELGEELLARPAARDC